MINNKFYDYFFTGYDTLGLNKEHFFVEEHDSEQLDIFDFMQEDDERTI